MTPIDTLCESAKLRLIANAIGLQQCTRTAACIIPIPGTQDVIAIGPRAWIAKNVPGVEATVEGVQPVAWITYGTIDGKKSLDIGSVASNLEYIKVHKEWRWQSLYLAATTQASTAPHDAGDARKVWDAALSHAALYVEAHCVDGETHAAAITSSARPVFAAIASQASTAQAEPGELEKLRAQVQQLEAMLADRVERKPNNEQEWAKVDGAVAFHLIERHADNWNDAGNMMESWARTRATATSSTDAQAAAKVRDSELLDFLDNWLTKNKEEGWNEFHFAFDHSGSAREQIAEQIEIERQERTLAAAEERESSMEDIMAREKARRAGLDAAFDALRAGDTGEPA